MKVLRFKKIISVSCSIASILLFTASAYAYSVNINNVIPQEQQQTFWCWAATSSMAANYLGVSSATQSNIVTAAFGSPYNVTGTVNDMKRGLAAYGITSTALNTSIAFNTIVSNIDSRSNVITTIKQSNGNGHALLIKGYYSDVQNLYYVDPADASSNVMAYSTYKSNSNWNWIDSLTSIAKN